MSKTFQFEALSAPTSIMAAHWFGDDPFEAEIFFQNDCFTELYGSLLGHRLMDIFDSILLRSGDRSVSISGRDLLARLLREGHINLDQGVLTHKRVELFARLQKETPKTIQLTVFDTTHHYFDALTGIPGRSLFFDRLKIELLRAVREKTEVYLCFLDLDGFKPINDSYGHHTGDFVLKEVAQRLKGLVRRHETVARLGGDEFIVMLSGSDIDPLQFAENKIIPLVNEPYVVGRQSIDLMGV
ncbi:MAG: GGDEF domain-containing protein, partial [Mariprofundaceae bacterium]